MKSFFEGIRLSLEIMKSFFDGIRPSPAVMKFSEGIVSSHGPVTLTCSTR